MYMVPLGYVYSSISGAKNAFFFSVGKSRSHASLYARVDGQNIILTDVFSSLYLFFSRRTGDLPIMLSVIVPVILSVILSLSDDSHIKREQLH